MQDALRYARGDASVAKVTLVSAKSTPRTRKWREAHRDENREYMRDYMKHRREVTRK